MLLQKVNNNHNKKMEIGYLKSIKKFKKNIKDSIKSGNTYCYFDIDNAFLYGYDRKKEKKIYSYIIPKLEKYYKGCVVFELNNHGYCNTHLRILASIIK